MRNSFLIVLVVLATSGATGANAEEAQLSLHSTVSGNREQPRVMYIVPWQQPAAAQFDYELKNSIATEMFSQVDRYEFNRAMAYRDLVMERSTDEDSVAALPDSTLHRED